MGGSTDRIRARVGAAERVSTGHSLDAVASAHRFELLAKAIPVQLEATGSGIYFLFRRGEVVYVGQSETICTRVAQHMADKKKVFDSYSWVRVKKDDLNFMETAYIQRFRPEDNGNGGPMQRQEFAKRVGFNPDNWYHGNRRSLCRTRKFGSETHVWLKCNPPTVALVEVRFLDGSGFCYRKSITICFKRAERLSKWCSKRTAEANLCGLRYDPPLLSRTARHTCSVLLPLSDGAVGKSAAATTDLQTGEQIEIAV